MTVGPTAVAVPVVDDQRDRRLVGSRARRAYAVSGALVLLVAAMLLSLSVGSNPMSPARAWEVLLHPDGSAESGVVHELRLPRTAVAVLVGACLALAGALMQAMTRNPLAEPGILGVNAGASLAVVTAVALGGASGIAQFVWFAFAGAAAAAVGVHLLAGTSRHTASPARLALAGVTVTAALAAITETVTLLDQHAFNEFRFWVAGSLEGRGWSVLATVAPFAVAGLVVALVLGPALNVLLLGDESARGLGVRPGLVRGLALVAVSLLAGSATAAVGPISFVGLAVPMVARAVVGHDHRWVAVLSLLLGPVWLLLADVVARVVVAPQETQVGIVAALVGAPVFVAVVRRRKVPTL